MFYRRAGHLVPRDDRHLQRSNRAPTTLAGTSTRLNPKALSPVSARSNCRLPLPKNLPECCASSSAGPSLRYGNTSVREGGGAARRIRLAMKCAFVNGGGGWGKTIIWRGNKVSQNISLVASFSPAIRTDPTSPTYHFTLHTSHITHHGTPPSPYHGPSPAQPVPRLSNNRRWLPNCTSPGRTPSSPAWRPSSARRVLPFLPES